MTQLQYRPQLTWRPIQAWMKALDIYAIFRLCASTDLQIANGVLAWFSDRLKGTALRAIAVMQYYSDTNSVWRCAPLRQTYRWVHLVILWWVVHSKSRFQKAKKNWRKLSNIPQRQAAKNDCKYSIGSRVVKSAAGDRADELIGRDQATITRACEKI